jgi:NAD(P)-dependent dehydrogenase (short-subunit alcohol dehydrogenase family)
MGEKSVLRREFLALGAAVALATRQSLGADIPPGPQLKTVCVLGASGRVGNLVVRQLLAAGFRVVAVSRSVDKLSRISTTYSNTGRIGTLQGDVSSEAQAADLMNRFSAAFGNPHGVVASLSSTDVDGPMRILDSPTDTLRKAFETNFFTHVIAAKAWIPALSSGGVYVGINGGLADFAAAGMGQLTTTQSAIRSLYEVVAREAQDPKRPQDHRPFVRVLELYGLVDDGSAPISRTELRIGGSVVGTRVADIIARPMEFPGPVLTLKSKAFS